MYTAVNVTTSATALITGSTAYDCVSLHNASDVTIYVGDDSSVTTSTGFPVAAGEKLNLSRSPGRQAITDTIYGIHGGSGSKSMRVLALP